MRRQRFWWTYLVGCIVCIVYGGGTLIYHFRKGNGLSIHSLILLVIGSICLLVFLVLYIWSLIQKPRKKEPEPPIEEPIEETSEEPVKNTSEEIEEDNEPSPVVHPSNNDVEYVSSRPTSHRTPSRSSRGDAYIKKVGYGPALRVNGDRIYDMRNNTYYRIEGNIVNQEGSGPAFEISGSRIRVAFGNYLYEISGGNVNKVYGGYFASIDSGRITKHDLSETYEISGDLDRVQKLVVVALIFGAY